MSEEKFETMMSQYGKRCYLHKLTDTKEVSHRAGFGVKVKAQPSDYVVTLNGVTFYAEVKSSISDTSFPLANIRTNQSAAATRVLAAGGEYWFYVLRTKTGTWYRVPSIVFAECVRASMKWTELSEWQI